MKHFLSFLLWFLTLNYYVVLNNVVSSQTQSSKNLIKHKKLIINKNVFLESTPSAVYSLTLEGNTVPVKLEKISEDDAEEQVCTLTLTPKEKSNSISFTDPIHLFTIGNENIGKEMQLKFIKKDIADLVNMDSLHSKKMLLKLKCVTTGDGKPETFTEDINVKVYTGSGEAFFDPIVKTGHQKTIIVENPNEAVSTFFPFLIPKSGIQESRFFSQQSTFAPKLKKLVLTPFNIIQRGNDFHISPEININSFGVKFSLNIDEDVEEQSTVTSFPSTPNNDVIFESFTISGVRPLHVVPESLNKVLEWEINSQTLDTKLKVKETSTERTYTCDASLSLGNEPKLDPRIPSIIQLIDCNQLNCGREAKFHFEPKLLGEIQDLQILNNQNMWLSLSCNWDDGIGINPLNKVTAQVKWIVPRSVPLKKSRTAHISVPIQRIDPKLATLDYFPYEIPQEGLAHTFVYSRQITKINCDNSVRLDPMLSSGTDLTMFLTTLIIIPDLVCTTKNSGNKFGLEQVDINQSEHGTNEDSGVHEDKTVGQEDGKDEKEDNPNILDSTIQIVDEQDEVGKMNRNLKTSNSKKKTKTKCETKACETISISFSRMRPKHTSQPCCKKENGSSQSLIDTPNEQKEAKSMAYRNKVSYLVAFLFFHFLHFLIYILG